MAAKLLPKVGAGRSFACKQAPTGAAGHGRVGAASAAKHPPKPGSPYGITRTPDTPRATNRIVPVSLRPNRTLNRRTRTRTVIPAVAKRRAGMSG